MGIWSNFFGRGETGHRIGCGFLDSREIDTGLAGELSPARSQAFDEHQLAGCNACALLAADLEVFAGVINGAVLETERREFDISAGGLRARLRQELAARDAARRPASRFNWTIAASLALAALMLAIVLPHMMPSPPNVLTLGRGVTHTVEPLPDLPVTRGAEALLQRAGQAYADGEYAEAASLFAEVERIEPERHDAVLYRGVSLLLAGEPEAAIEVLQRSRALAEEQGLLGAVDDWYLGQAAAGVGDLDLARTVLARAAAADSPLAGRAGELLDKLTLDGN